jgi:hypothetical protein
MNTKANTTNSGYACEAQFIYDTTEYDCSGLNAEQMTAIGQAAENGANAWGWRHDPTNRNNDGGNWASVDEAIAAYVGGEWEAQRIDAAKRD